MTDVRIDHGVTSGTFTLDGETFEVENNIWVIGNDRKCMVIDAPHDVDAILKVVGDREVTAILCTHGHDDHVRVAPELGQRTNAPIMINPADLPVWQLTHPNVRPDGDLNDRDLIAIGGIGVWVLHTPGHSPGGVCFYAKDLGIVFTGDTLFKGGPGATGRSFSSEKQILDSIRTKLFELPDETIVHTGHGESTTIGAERALLSNSTPK